MSERRRRMVTTKRCSDCGAYMSIEFEENPQYQFPLEHLWCNVCDEYKFKAISLSRNGILLAVTQKTQTRQKLKE